MNDIEYQKHMIESNFDELIEIMKLYCKFKDVTNFILDLQIYNNTDNSTEPRIWLSAQKDDLGINLMLYSINLHGIANENACEVFSEYMQYYAINENKFKTTTKYNFETTFKISFEVSNRS